MFEQIFREQLASCSSDEKLIADLWLEVKTQYSNAKRYYHNLSHLDDLVGELFPVKEKISDWQILIFSIAYHDIIYNPLKNDNEERSAKLAFERLSNLSISTAQCEKCSSQILATKIHAESEDQDTNFLTDADLAILGSDNDRYREYASQIRKEYNWYPDFVYKPGRKKVLEHFLQMTQIYKTDHFRTRYEKQARTNLNDELNSL